jgi:flagellar hook protein FlgE
MMRALFAGVSGLRNHLTRMDVIGNNIANVNTVAFKSSRVTFKEAFAQLLQGASRPPGDQGGINPIQVGLGMTIGSVDQNFAQGNLETTGQTTDLAIQGDGFFVTSDGSRRYFTRSGNFQLDADGRLVAPTNGFIVQGRTADAAGELSSGSAIGDIILPFGQKSPAKASSEITLSGNLDSRATPLGTILQTQGMVFAIEKSTSGSNVNGLYANGNADAQILGMTPNSTTVAVSDGTTSRTFTYVTTDTGASDLAFHSMQDLVNEINSAFAGLTAAINPATGAIAVTNGSGAGITLGLTSTNSQLSLAFSSANGALANGATSAATDQFSHVAKATDVLTDLRDGAGTNMGLTAGNTILFDGNLGGNAVTQGTLSVAGTSTYRDFLTAINGTFTLSNATRAEVDASSGALVINGDGGTVNALGSVNIRVNGGTRPAFDAIFASLPGNYTELQSATDVTQTAPISVYDSMGNPHTVSITFTKDPTALNRWTWSAEVPAPAVVTGGDTGAVTFDSEGRLETFTYNSGSTSFQFDPNTGASSPVNIEFRAGTVGGIDGLAQFASASTAVASGQDGYPMGNLQDISINTEGVITGFFTNGVSQTLAQISLASFNNPSGLLRQGDNMYATSGNSGEPVVGFAGTSNQSSITSGALESSNVDLAAEFTNMIIAQRGFQANSRVITTSDQMLQELVNLKQ